MQDPILDQIDLEISAATSRYTVRLRNKALPFEFNYIFIIYYYKYVYLLLVYYLVIYLFMIKKERKKERKGKGNSIFRGELPEYIFCNVIILYAKKSTNG